MDGGMVGPRILHVAITVLGISGSIGFAAGVVMRAIWHFSLQLQLLLLFAKLRRIPFVVVHLLMFFCTCILP